MGLQVAAALILLSITAGGTPTPTDGNDLQPVPLAINLTATVNVTIRTQPPGLDVLVDGVGFTSPQTFDWENGSDHLVAAVSPQTFGDLRQAFTKWSDGLPVEHHFLVSGPGEIVAAFRTEYSVDISSIPPGLDLIIDGAHYAGSFSDWWAEGTTHTVYNSQVQDFNGTRYSRQTWSDGGNSFHAVTVSGPISLTASFATDYLLSVGTALGAASGCVSTPCWQPAGTQAFFNLTGGPVDSAATRYSFMGWNAEPGDIFIPGSYSAPSSILMDGPKNVTALWKTEHYLSVTTAYGHAVGEDWYLAGAQASFNVTNRPAPESGTRHELRGWMSEPGAVPAFGSIVIDGPKNVTAVWVPQHFLTVNSPYGEASASGWFDEGTKASFDLASVHVGTSGTRHDFQRWSTQQGYGSESGSVIMDGPKTATAVWATQHYLDVRSAFGQVSGSGWYAAGHAAHVSLGSTEATVDGERWRFEGWSGAVYSTDREVVVLMDSPRTVIAQWRIVPSPVPPPIPFSAAAATAAGVLAIMGLIVVSTPRGEFALGGLAVPLFTRLRRDDVRNQFTRGRLLQHIEENPGASYTRIRRDLGLSNGACAYHLRVLEQNGQLRRVVQGASVRFYGMDYKFDAEALPPLAHYQRRILESIVEAGSATFAELADILATRGLEVTEANLGYHLKVLAQRKQLISTRREGRKTVYFVEAEHREFLRRRLREELGLDEALDMAAISGGDIAAGDLDGERGRRRGEVVLALEGVEPLNGSRRESGPEASRGKPQ